MATEIVIPRALPYPLAKPHTFSPVDAARTGEADQGELRRRPRYSVVPQNLRVEWLLDQGDFDTFWTWFEETLLGGEKRFDVRVERQGTAGLARGSRLTWWTAQFVGMPEQEALHRGRYRVAATLLLIGQPFDVRVPPGILASGGIKFRGGAIVAAPHVRAAGSIEFRGGWRAQPARVIAQGSTTFGGGWNTGIAPVPYRITPEGDFRVTPEGDSRVYIGS